MEEQRSLCGVPRTSNSLCEGHEARSTRFRGVQLGQNNKVSLGGGVVVMSDEELRIRGELEMDIERDLEEELKDGIYHLALRLHRLYQHQNERNESSSSSSSSELSNKLPGGFQNQQNNNKALSEVNISIKMEGGTKIEFKEVKKKETLTTRRPRTSSRSDHMVVSASSKRFDWAKSLRGAPQAPPPVVINIIDDKKNGSFDKANKVQRNNNNNPTSVFHNSGLENGKRNNSTAYGIAPRRKEKPEAAEKITVLELGWRD